MNIAGNALAQITAETLALAKASLGAPLKDRSNLSFLKSITTGTGLVSFDLQAPAKNLYPTMTPIRNRMPRVGGGTGTATNWRYVSAAIGSGYSSMPWVPEGQRSGRMSYIAGTKAASYVTIGEEDQITFEAIRAAVGLEDERAMMTMRLLQRMMMKEEVALIGGNASVQLGQVGTISTSASGSGGTLPAITYDVGCVALTMEGLLAINGGRLPLMPYNPTSAPKYLVQTTKTITGADGNTYTLNGGSSQGASIVTQAVSSGQTLFASVPAIPGAVAYAWYVGAAGAASLQAITPINSVSISTALATLRQLYSAVGGADYSSNSIAYDGLLSSLVSTFNAGGLAAAYYNQLATGTAGTGTKLTASGNGSVSEIDAMFQTMWDNYNMGVSVLYVNSQQLLDIRSKVLGNNGAPLVRFVMDGKDDRPIMAAGQVIGFYFNPFTLEGGRMIPIRLHPFVPAGTILGYAEDLPAQYQSNNVPNVAEVKLRAEYEEIEWPLRTRQREHGIYAEEVLAVYAPFALGAVANIAAG